MPAKQWNRPPEMQIDASKTYKAVIETGKGTIELELYPQQEDSQQLRLPGPGGLLRRRNLPPGDQRFHDPGGRPDRFRGRRPRLPV